MVTSTTHRHWTCIYLSRIYHRCCTTIKKIIEGPWFWRCFSDGRQLRTKPWDVPICWGISVLKDVFWYTCSWWKQIDVLNLCAPFHGEADEKHTHFYTTLCFQHWISATSIRDLVARVFCNKSILQGEADEKSHGEAAKLGLLILAWAGRLNKMHESHGPVQIVRQLHGSFFHDYHFAFWWSCS